MTSIHDRDTKLRTRVAEAHARAGMRAYNMCTFRLCSRESRCLGCEGECTRACDSCMRRLHAPVCTAGTMVTALRNWTTLTTPSLVDGPWFWARASHMKTSITHENPRSQDVARPRGFDSDGVRTALKCTGVWLSSPLEPGIRG